MAQTVSNPKSKGLNTDFKLQLLQMVRTQGLNISLVCKDMKLRESAVKRWLGQFEAEQSDHTGIVKPLTVEHHRIRHLEQENRRLTGNVDILKKALAFCPKTCMRYCLIQRLQTKANPGKANTRDVNGTAATGDITPEFSVITTNQACKALGVSRSGCCAHQSMTRQRPAEPVVRAASVHLKVAFAASHKAYGSRRLTTAMAEPHLAMSRHGVRILMLLNNIQPVWRRKFVQTTDSKHTMAVLTNVLKRQLKQAWPNQVWVCDITYIRTRSSWLHLAAVLDLHSRKMVSWTMASARPAALVRAALRMAIV